MSVIAITTPLLLLPLLLSPSFPSADESELQRKRLGFKTESTTARPLRFRRQSDHRQAPRSRGTGLGLSWASALCTKMCVWVCKCQVKCVYVCVCGWERGLPATFTKFQQQRWFHNILCKAKVRVCCLESTCMSKCAHVCVCMGRVSVVCMYVCPYAQHGSPQWVSSGSWWLTGIFRFHILSQKGHAKQVWKCVCLCVCDTACEMWGRLYLSFLHSSWDHTDCSLYFFSWPTLRGPQQSW